MKISPEHLSLEFSIIHRPLNGEPNRALLHIHGDIGLDSPDLDDEDDPIKIGEVRAYKFLPQVAEDAKISMFDALDCIDDSVAEYTLLLNEDGTALSDAVNAYYEDVFGDELLILDRIEIDPQYRGHHLGLLAAAATMDVFASSEVLVALKPFPVQFAGMNDPRWKERNPNLNEADFEPAQEKLRRYWEKMGFEQYTPTDLWCLTTARIHPTADDIGAGNFSESESMVIVNTPKKLRAKHSHNRRS